jgi:hypothetical protein
VQKSGVLGSSWRPAPLEPAGPLGRDAPSASPLGRGAYSCTKEHSIYLSYLPENSIK